MTDRETISESWNKRRRAARAWLHGKFPNAFMAAGNWTKRPLKIGIRNDVMDAIKDMEDAPPRHLVFAAIGDYAQGATYVLSLKEGEPRIDLDGRIVDFVSASHAAHAVKRLRTSLEAMRRAETKSDRFKALMGEIEAAIEARSVAVEAAA